jgi:hypothetical protein
MDHLLSKEMGRGFTAPISLHKSIVKKPFKDQWYFVLAGSIATMFVPIFVVITPPPTHIKRVGFFDGWTNFSHSQTAFLDHKLVPDPKNNGIMSLVLRVCSSVG